MRDSLLPIKPIVLNPDFATTRMVIPTERSEDLSAKDNSKGGLRTRGYSKQSCGSTAEGSEFYPLVTVITVVYNNDRYLKTTIDSVLAQSYDNLEYIIVDGGSTDGTLDLIHQHEDRIDYWISEPDKGLYDAMNKGVALASGEIIGILNSDDLYFTNTVEQVVEEYRQHSTPCVIYGSMRKFVDEEKIISINRGDLSDRAFDTASIVINHPTCFVSRSLYQDFGGFKPEYEVGADRELMMRFHSQGVEFINLERALAQFRLGGTTSDRSLSSIFNHEVVQEYLLLSEYKVNKTTIAKVLGKKTIQALRKWIIYRVLGERLANKLIMSYISYKFSRPSERLAGREDRVKSD